MQKELETKRYMRFRLRSSSYRMTCTEEGYSQNDTFVQIVVLLLTRQRMFIYVLYLILLEISALSPQYDE